MDFFCISYNINTSTLFEFKEFWIFFIYYNINISTLFEFKDFWIFSKTFCFSQNITLGDQGFLDFSGFTKHWYFHTIGIQGFLDILKTFSSFPDYHTRDIKDFWIFSFLAILTLPHNWISRIFGFFKKIFCLPQIIAIG